MGTVEQEQKGVIAPRLVPRRYCTHVSLLERKSGYGKVQIFGQQPDEKGNGNKDQISSR